MSLGARAVISHRNVLCVIGARPNYMKMAPLLRAFAHRADAPHPVLVHTGQHYDPMMKDRLMADVRMPAPDENLDVRSGSHAVQTAEVMKRFEPLLDHYDPLAVVVVGDVNSTLACSLVAAKRLVPVAHVEAGLRSGDRTMPEEVNRILTDQMSDLLYTTDAGAKDNLLCEGIDPQRIHFVGNLMIDSLHDALPRALSPGDSLAAAGAAEFAERIGRGYALVTLHRPSNVDDAQVLAGHVDTLLRTARHLPVVWPVHPRAKAQLEKSGLWGRLQTPNIVCLPPQGYLEMVGLMRDAKVVITDSGGVQEETTALGVPCLTLRHNTERPITVTHGTNRLVGCDPAAAWKAIQRVLDGDVPRGRVPAGWDGQGAHRLMHHFLHWLKGKAAAAPARDARLAA
jgi:UDP-N-acetylglucosamine 2-epimerase (non-hydrolysing)